jgi:hypothetical protein
MLERRALAGIAFGLSSVSLVALAQAARETAHRSVQESTERYPRGGSLRS